MAIVEKNIIIEGLSGKLGKMLVFRQRGGKTIVAATPRKTDKAPSEAQEIRREKFRQAVAYAQSVLENPSLKTLYAAKLHTHQSVYHAALSDYLHAPQILEINTQAYSGNKGDQVYINAIDEGRVTAVTVAFYRPDGSLAAEGAAAPGEQETAWIYTARENVEGWEKLRLVVRATDIPGNITEEESRLKEDI